MIYVYALSHIARSNKTAVKEDHDCVAICNSITDEIRSFMDHYHKQQNGILQCIEISNAGETRKEECFLTI